MHARHIQAYMDSAQAFAQCSHAVRKKVGAVAVTPDDVIVYSYNGTAAGDDNACEDMLQDGSLVTKPEVLHAEENVVAKAARVGVSLQGSTVFVTLAPCFQCAKLLKNAGVQKVVYGEDYRDMSGAAYLEQRGVEVVKYGG